MTTNEVDLGRFRLEGLLGEGAELQVFAATDAETGRQVVVKRPHPTLIGRLQHRDIEERLARLISLRADPRNPLPSLSRLIGSSMTRNHDAYFGDSLGQSYTVTVEERARGLPLVASAMDGIKGAPIGLPQNLFAVHPLVRHREKGFSAILRDVLEVAEAFHKAGYLLLDLRPQNVFFDPKCATITVIDVGNMMVPRPETRRRAPLDLHDLYLELFKWYATLATPPEDAAAYESPYGMASVARFPQDLDRMVEEYSIGLEEPVRAVAIAILEKVRQRGYGGLDEFRRDLEEYILLSEERYSRLSESPLLGAAWRTAMDKLKEPYWTKYLFDADADLVAYESG